MVGGVVVDVNASIYNEGGAIVDSGSTDMTIPKKAFDALKKVREGASGGRGGEGGEGESQVRFKDSMCSTLGGEIRLKVRCLVVPTPRWLVD